MNSPLIPFLSAWSPPFLWGLAILVSSGNLGSAQNTQVILRWLLSLVPALIGHLDTIHLALRKLGHMVAYGVLFLLWFRAFGFHRPRPFRSLGYALACTLLVAVLDEGHQALVGTRHGSLRDVGWDLAGAGLAGFFALAFWKPKTPRG